MTSTSTLTSTLISTLTSAPRPPDLDLDLDLDLNLFLYNNNLLDDVSLSDLVDHFQSLVNFAEAGVLAVQVSGIATAVADKKLGSPGVAACMGHGKDAPVVVLVSAIQLAFNRVPRSTGAGAVGTTTLDYKIGDTR